MWKDLVYFEDRYEIDEDGNIRNKETSRIVQSSINKYGYRQIGIRKIGDRKKYWFLIHRLVVLHFQDDLPESWDELQVDHIDHNKLNNNITNLRLVNSVENNSCRKFEAWNTNKTTGELYITKYNNGFMIRINRSDYKCQKWVLTLEEAILYRDKFIEEIHAIKK